MLFVVLMPIKMK